MEYFAYRCGAEWVLWNSGPWNSGGWINISAIHAPTRAGVKRQSFSLGWDGKRFAAGKEAERLARFDPEAPDLLRVFLSEAVKAPTKDGDT